MMEVCKGIKVYGERLRAAAYECAAKEEDPNRVRELKEAGDRAQKICWDTPDTFAEALHAVWLNTMMLNVEASGPCINVGRLDQLLWPYLEADLEKGTETVDSALEWMEEYNIKCCNIPWLLTEALAHGILPKGCPGYGAGTRIGCESGDPRTFKTYDEFYEAFLRQYRYQIDLCQEHMLVAEKILAEEHQMPLFTMMTTGAIEKGKDVVSGGAILNSGPHYMLSGVADMGDSLMAVKKLVYDDKSATMEQLLEALEHDFEGYEDIRQMCLDAPKYGNDIDEVDYITSKALQDCAEYCATLKCGRAGNYSSAGVQPTQTNVAMGEQCWALPSGRKALTPLADTLSAEQHMDMHGPLAALHSYGKINHSACTNGTILNMRISKTDLIAE